MWLFIYRLIYYIHTMKFIQLYDSLLKYKPNLASDKPSSLTNKFASNILNKSFYLNPTSKFRVNDWWSLARVWQHWLRAVKINAKNPPKNKPTFGTRIGAVFRRFPNQNKKKERKQYRNDGPSKEQNGFSKFNQINLPKALSAMQCRIKKIGTPLVGRVASNFEQNR